MVERPASVRASGSVRMLGLLVLLLGIAAMHVGMFSSEPGPHHDATGTVMVMPSAEQHDRMTHPVGGHAVMHACVFILSAAALVIGLGVSFHAPTDRDGDQLPPARFWRARAERPPPWTVPSLDQLSILRI